MLFIPYGSKYTAIASGFAWRRVVCQHCGCDFVYRVTSSAEGSSTSFLWLNKNEAKAGANTQANSLLEKQLIKASLNICCPNCGYYQDYMVKDIISNARFLRIGRALLLVIIIGITVTCILQYLGFNNSISLLIAFVLAIIILLFRIINYHEKDPNQDAQNRINQSYSENYPVLLTSVLMQKQGEKKAENLEK